MKKLILAVIFFLLLTFPSQAFAQYGQVVTVNPCAQMMIDKKVLNPQNNQFVDSLNLDQHTFLPDQDLIYRITVTNVIQSDLRNLVITDKLPDALNFVSTSFGNYDANTRTISFNIDSLKVGESKTIEVKTKIKGASEILANVLCQDNRARVTMDNLVCEDTARVCVSKQVMGVTQVIPVTGPTKTLPVFLLSSLLLAIGLLIKRILYLERR